MASRLEDISQQLASLTTILVGAEDDSQDDNSSHCSVLRKLAAESEESGEDQLELDSCWCTWCGPRTGPAATWVWGRGVADT